MLPELEALKMVPAYLVPAGIVMFVGVKVLIAKDQAGAALSREFAGAVERLNADHRSEIEGLIGKFWQTQEEWKGEVKEIIDNYVEITRETIVAVKGLESSLRELKEYVGKSAEPEK